MEIAGGGRTSLSPSQAHTVSALIPSGIDSSGLTNLNQQRVIGTFGFKNSNSLNKNSPAKEEKDEETMNKSIQKMSAKSVLVRDSTVALFGKIVITMFISNSKL